MSLGQYLRDLRDKRDLSLREFAKKLDCSAAFISDIELGRRYPSEKVLSDMAGVLNVPLAELKEQDDRPPTEGIKRLIASNPSYALAFRTIVEGSVSPSPEQLMELARKVRASEPGNKK